ncbi:hypothetical protein F9C11_20945 [Amycolatopsis sp. VS8301801F10]|uniref:hypothetical protein n=1 Tax=Amycolatopsis sp. VS8301801F10 TaxID=2652442 RepID=UPI0038FC7DDB
MKNTRPSRLNEAGQFFELIDGLVRRPRVDDRPRKTLPMLSLQCPLRNSEDLLDTVELHLLSARPEPVPYAYVSLSDDPQSNGTGVTRVGVTGVPDIAALLWAASRQFTRVPSHSGRLRFKLFSLLMVLLTLRSNDDTDLERTLYRRIHTWALTSRLGPGLAPVEGGLHQAPWWILPLRMITLVWFRIAVTGRVPLLSGPYRWFMRQPHLAPEMSGTFGCFAQRLTDGEWQKESPEQVNRLLVNTFLQDLRRAYRPRPWLVWRTRRTTPVVLMLGNPTAGNGGKKLAQTVNDVRNQTGQFDPLLVITAGPNVLLRKELEASLYSFRNALDAYQDWRDRLPNSRRKYSEAAWHLPMLVPADDVSSEADAHWDLPRGRLPPIVTTQPWWMWRSVRLLALIGVVIGAAVTIASLCATAETARRVTVLGAYTAGALCVVTALITLASAADRVFSRAREDRNRACAAGSRPRMDLTQFADEYLGTRGGTCRAAVIAADTAKIARIELARLEPMLAARLWQLVDTVEPTGPARLSPLRQRLAEKGVFPGVLAKTTEIMVPHSDGRRFDLVVFDPALPPGAKPVRVSVDMPALLAQVQDRRTDLPERLWGLEPPPEVFVHEASTWPRRLRESLIEASEIRDYAVLVASAPRLVSTAGRGSGCLSVAAGASTVGTVGVAAVTAAGEAVLTTARHAVAGHENLAVSGHPSRVLAEHVVVDCSTLEISTTLKQHLPDPPHQVLALSPRLYEQAVFHGARSGTKTTTVTGFDPVLLSYGSHTAVRVYTNADTAGGDSGAALLDSDGQLMGFCCERTAYGAAVQFTSWIWAQQVLDLMGINL